MLRYLLHGVLPVFAIGLVGYVLGIRGVFDFQMAMAINRFVMMVGMPALGFRLLARAPLEEFNLMMLGGYFITEAVMYFGSFAIARYLFNVDIKEAVLLGLAVALTNHVLFVLPIATELFGEAAVTPIVAIISMDGIFLFCGTIVLMDVLASREATAGETIGKIARNPPLVAMVLGLGVGMLNLPIPKGPDVFLKLLADAAAPALLFALGVILSQPQEKGRTLLPLTLTGMKLVIHPLLAWAIFVWFLDLSPDIRTPAMMVAAAPCGVMAFMLALNYQVRVDVIAKAILYSAIGSLITVTLAAGL